GGGAGGGEGDGAEELDGADGSERQARDGEVEAGVHEREDDAEQRDEAPIFPVHAGERPPRSTPDREDEAGAGDAQPGDAERRDAGEEEHREGRAEVVEEGAGDEVQVGWRPRSHTFNMACGIPMSHVEAKADVEYFLRIEGKNAKRPSGLQAAPRSQEPRDREDPPRRAARPAGGAGAAHDDV